MNLIYPLGLLLLIAIPVLIVIYIIKNKYKEKTVSSNYVWELSKKFVKKKNPINTLANLLALILQCLTIAFLGLALADPLLTFKNGAENKVYILDASASMATKNIDGTTRFDEAKQRIKDDAQGAVDGTTYTLIVSDSSTRYACQQITDYQVFLSFLDRVDIDMADSDLDSALSLAQTSASLEEGSQFFLITDKQVDAGEGIEVFQVGDTDSNYAISDMSYTYNDDELDSTLEIQTDFVSYSQDAKITVDYAIDGTSIGQKQVELKKGEEQTLDFTISDASQAYKGFSSIKATILEEDYLAEDSEFIIYNTSDFDTTDILIVSYSPFYFESAFKALDRNNTKITYQTVTPDMYGGGVGFDIYIFDGYSPLTLPADGAVWLFNVGSTIDNAGFYVQKGYTVDDPGATFTYAENSDDLLYQELTKNLAKRDITVKSYMRYTLNSRFTTLISYNNLPCVFAGRTDYGQREIVCNFDLHDSDLPLLADFVGLMRNFISYSNPQILTSFAYQAHDQVTFSFPDNAKSCTITTPSGDVDVLSPTDIQKYNLKEVGTYQVEVELVTGKTREMNLFASFPQDERLPKPLDNKTRTIVVDSQADKANRLYDAVLPMVIVAVVFLLTDWILYGHEQF